MAVDRPHDAVVLDAGALAAPVVGADARLLAILRRYGDELLARRPPGATSWPGPSAGR